MCDHSASPTLKAEASRPAATNFFSEVKVHPKYDIPTGKKAARGAQGRHQNLHVEESA